MFDLIITVLIYLALPVVTVIGLLKAFHFFRRPLSLYTKDMMLAAGKSPDLFSLPVPISIRYSADSLSCVIRQIGNFGTHPYDRLYLSYLSASRSSPFLVREQAHDGSFVVHYLSKTIEGLEADWMQLHSLASVLCREIYGSNTKIDSIERKVTF